MFFFLYIIYISTSHCRKFSWKRIEVFLTWHYKIEIQAEKTLTHNWIAIVIIHDKNFEYLGHQSNLFVWSSLSRLKKIMWKVAPYVNKIPKNKKIIIAIFSSFFLSWVKSIWSINNKTWLRRNISMLDNTKNFPQTFHMICIIDYVILCFLIFSLHDIFFFFSLGKFLLIHHHLF